MERKRREELAAYFEAPKPVGKRAFTRQFGMQRMSWLHMVAMQARYISKWVWIFSLLFFGITYLVAQATEWKYVSMVLGFVPFLVMLSVTESMRSYRYGMEELEVSTRFSLKSIVLARMVILGLGNTAVLTGIMVVLRNQSQIHIAYVMAPYFLTAGGGLRIVRNLRGKESTMLCFGLASLVCVLELYIPWQFEVLFTPENVWLWISACVIGLIVTVRESYRMVGMMEVLAWN